MFWASKHVVQHFFFHVQNIFWTSNFFTTKHISDGQQILWMSNKQLEVQKKFLDVQTNFWTSNFSKIIWSTIFALLATWIDHSKRVRRIKGVASGRVSGRTSGWTSGRTSGRTFGRASGRMHACSAGRPAAGVRPNVRPDDARAARRPAAGHLKQCA